MKLANQIFKYFSFYVQSLILVQSAIDSIKNIVSEKAKKDAVAILLDLASTKKESSPEHFLTDNIFQ